MKIKNTKPRINAVSASDNKTAYESPFPAITGDIVYKRSYARVREDNTRENWIDTINRNISYLTSIGKFTPEETKLVQDYALALKALPAGRLLWCGGTEWLNKPENYYGAYNCHGGDIVDEDSFRLQVYLGMCGTGTGALVTKKNIEKIPEVSCKIHLIKIIDPGTYSKRQENTILTREKDNTYCLVIGDSKAGWADAMKYIIGISTKPKQYLDSQYSEQEVYLTLDLGYVRPKGTPLKGFGGTANPDALGPNFKDIVDIVNDAFGRKLTATEISLILDLAADFIVAGAIRRSACIRQGDADDEEFKDAKKNLWTQDSEGNWIVDPRRKATRNANYTRVFLTYPSYEEILDSVASQAETGEGALQFAPVIIARSSSDILDTEEKKLLFIDLLSSKGKEAAKQYLKELSGITDEVELEDRMGRFCLNPCGEGTGKNFMCNLADVHLNMLDPYNLQEQDEAFTASTLSVAALLHHKFVDPILQYAREKDPIVMVTFTGSFDFFIKLFGRTYLEWWCSGRDPDFDKEITFVNPFTSNKETHKAASIIPKIEVTYYTRWRQTVERVLKNYCDKHGLRVPNRCTAIAPSGTKALLTNSSPGLHPSFAPYYIRRITCRKDDPVALAAYEYGYNVVPGQKDVDENGVLLTDPFDPRVTEWLIEIPVKAAWVDTIKEDISDLELTNYPILAQIRNYELIQRYFTTHNSSATLQINGPEWVDGKAYPDKEVYDLASYIYKGTREGWYNSAAILPRSKGNLTFPRLPFEPISKETYDRLMKEFESRRKGDFNELVNKYQQKTAVETAANIGPAACDSDKCLM